MSSKWRCVTCQFREGGFCGALLGRSAQDSRQRQRPSWQDFQRLQANENIASRGDAPKYVYVLCEGWAFRFLRLSEGQRQILRFLLPGDLFAALTVFQERLPFSVQALTEAQVCRFDRAEVRSRLGANPLVGEELAKSCVADQDYADELLTALGQLSSEERIAYLFLHLMKRIAARSVIREHRYPFPVRQHHIAEMAGLTPVHVSRVIGALRDRGLIELSGGYLHVRNLPELERLGVLKVTRA